MYFSSHTTGNVGVAISGQQVTYASHIFHLVVAELSLIYSVVFLLCVSGYMSAKS